MRLRKITYVLFVIIMMFVFSSCKKECKHQSIEWVIDKQATCKEEGKRHTECTDCHIVLEEEVIPKKEHTWKDATTEAPKTCTICGTTEGEKLPGVKNNCKGCKKSSIAIILSGISLLCASIYLIRRKK